MNNGWLKLDIVQSGRPIFDDFFQHLWPYIGNSRLNVVFKWSKLRLWLIRIDQTPLHSPTENSLSGLNHNGLVEANSKVKT
ncbi:hypothetical protein TNCV_3343001 [Trichonephila clavipes]|nr:hypothetical protein TNCV_3343001 [Trichonephila clavipes]